MRKRKLKALVEFWQTEANRADARIGEIAQSLFAAGFGREGQSVIANVRTLVAERDNRHTRAQTAERDLLKAGHTLEAERVTLQQLHDALNAALEQLSIARKDLRASDVELASTRTDLEKSTAHGFDQEREIALGEQLVQKFRGHLLRIASGLHVDTTGSIDEVADACALQARLLDVDETVILEWLEVQAKAENEQTPLSERATRMTWLVDHFRKLWPGVPAEHLQNCTNRTSRSSDGACSCGLLASLGYVRIADDLYAKPNMSVFARDS